MNLGADRMRTRETGELSPDQQLQLKYWPLVAVQTGVSAETRWDPAAKTLLVAVRTAQDAPEPPGLGERLLALENSLQDLLGACAVVVDVDGYRVWPEVARAS